MTGRASAEIICKAKVIKYRDPANDDYEEYEEYEGYCSNVIRTELYGVWGELNFATPEGWHVELRDEADYPETIVRCPNHCTRTLTGNWESVP